MKFFSLFYKGELHKVTGEKILPAKEFSRLIKASNLLKETKEDAQKYREDVEKECEELKKEAQEAGFNQGLTEFNKQILYFEQQVKEIRHELQKIILPLALKAAKKIVGDELKINPDAIVTIVLQALKPVMQARQVKILVNKVDKALLEKKKKNIKAILEQVESFYIVDRSDIQKGGCIIETEAGIINASVENQWRALESAFEMFMKR